MSKLEQAARQALEVLKNQSPDRDMVRAAFALQEALAEQAEPSQLADASLEPVAWSQQRKRNLIKHWSFACGWDDLTGREIDDLELLINAVLNAAPVRQAEQKPVAYRVWDRMGGISYRRTKPSESEYVEWDALYAAPVRTKDLTDDEIQAVTDSVYGETDVDEVNYWRLEAARAVIQEFWRKNGIV